MDYASNFYMNAEQQVKAESDYYEYYFFNNDGEVANPIQSQESSINGGSSGISPIQYAYFQLAKGQITRDQLNGVLDRLKKNTFTMDEFATSINEFLAFRKYDILKSKGSISKKKAEAKAKAEYDEFNKTQKIISDFEKGLKSLSKGGSAD